MKRIISRVLLTVPLAVSLPLPVLWFTEATAQDVPADQSPSARLRVEDSSERITVRKLRLPHGGDRDRDESGRASCFQTTVGPTTKRNVQECSMS